MEDTLRGSECQEWCGGYSVLILILMEDTLRVLACLFARLLLATVLILILMEDTLRETRVLGGRGNQGVLILILMEDTLRVDIKTALLTLASES